MKKTLKSLRSLFEQKLKENQEDGRCFGSFFYGNSIITFSVGKNSKDIEVYNSVLDIFLDNVAEWLVYNSLDYSDIKKKEHIQSYICDGFSSEQDYLRYKFG